MKPLLVIFSGLPGVGKSSIAQMLSARLGAVYLRADTIENAIVEGGITQPIEGAGYVVGYRVATENLLLGNSVVADSVNPWELTRQAWRDSAIGANAPSGVMRSSARAQVGTGEGSRDAGGKGPGMMSCAGTTTNTNPAASCDWILQS